MRTKETEAPGMRLYLDPIDPPIYQVHYELWMFSSEQYLVLVQKCDPLSENSAHPAFMKTKIRLEIGIIAYMFNCTAVKRSVAWCQVVERKALQMRNATFQETQCFYAGTVNFNVSVYYRVT